MKGWSRIEWTLLLAYASVCALVGAALASEIGVETFPLGAVGFMVGAWAGFYDIDRVVESRNQQHEEEEQDERGERQRAT